MKKILLSLILILTSVCPVLGEEKSNLISEPKIRVKIFAESPWFVISVRGDYVIKVSDSDRILKYGKNLKAKAAGYKNGIILAGSYLAADNIFINPAQSDTWLEINGRRFKGGLQVIKRNNGLLCLVNYLGLEDYVKGISIREISHYWPMEALKANAVVFRTFAMYRMEQFKNKEWDVSDDVFSQVYGGMEAERYRITEAVDKTRGEVLNYDGKILPAFFHSTCGGATEDASIIWNLDIQPLKGVACGFCKESPHFKWTATIPKQKVRDVWEKQGQKIKNLQEVVIAGRDSSGRVINVDIVTGDKDIEVSAKDFRNLVGPDLIKSTNFKITSSNGNLLFEGQGWGHGVGLCQWGAYFMAKAGSEYPRILELYYPGSTLTKLNY